MVRTTFNLGPSNLLSLSLFGWVFKLLLIFIVKSPQDVLFSMEEDSKALVNSQALQRAWAKEEKRMRPSLIRTLARVFGRPYLVVSLWKLVWALCTWSSAWFLFKKMMAAETRTTLWAVMILLGSLIASVSIQAVYAGAAACTIKLRSALTMMVYNKALSLPPQDVVIGEIGQIISNDVEAVANATSHFHILWTGVIEILLICALLIWEAGVASLYPILIILTTLPIQLYLGVKASQYSSRCMKTASERLHLIVEVMTAIKLLKMYTWEAYFSKRIGEVRQREAAAAGSHILTRATIFAMGFAVPILGTLACLLSLQLADPNNRIDPTQAFVIISLLNTLRYPLLMMPLGVQACWSAQTALNSLNRFLTRPSMVDYRQNLPMKSDPVGKKGVVAMVNADLSWGQHANPTLTSVSMHVYPGEIIAIVGTVGSGKSTVIAGLLGQTEVPSGSVRVVGKTSYCPQDPWIMSATIQDNILFGTPMDRARYTKVLEVCALSRDLSLLGEGDQSKIVRSGANLSPGVKQRVSLARAVYNQSDIVLLDDPLGDMDQKVARTIFEKCIKGFLKDRAVVMVSHGLQHLYQVDRILHLGDGGVVEYGDYTELMAKPGGRLRGLVDARVDPGELIQDEAADAIQRFNTIQLPDDRDSSEMVSVEVHSIDADQRILDSITLYNHGMEVDENTLKQKAEYDHVATNGPYHSPATLSNAPSFKRSVDRNELSQLMYRADTNVDAQLGSTMKDDSHSGQESSDRGPFSYMGPSASLIICIIFFLVHAIRVGLDLWLKEWTTRGSSNPWLRLDTTVFTIFCGSFAVGVLIRGWLLTKLVAFKARTLHNRITESFLQAPMSFYDRTPLGRILHGASKQQSDADHALPDSALQLLQYAPFVIGSLLIVVMQSGWLLTPVLVALTMLAGIVFVLPHRIGALRFFNGKSKVAKPRMMLHVATSLQGLFTIRAFNAQARFRFVAMAHLDQANTWQIALQNIRFFVALYVDVVMSLAIFATVYSFVNQNVAPDQSVVIGLSLVNALQLLLFVQWTMRMFEETGNAFNSIGEVQSICDSIKPEADTTTTNQLQPDESPALRGQISFRDVSLRYSQYGVAVLSIVNFAVMPREKIGIVGKTGSGRSTLLAALMRITETCNGRICIDDIDTRTMGLQMLRKRIAIIPQEPVLFVGTVRSNLDPYGDSSDSDIWKSLAAVRIDAIIRAMLGGLDAEVVENGRSFTLAQRQLFCIARAILCKSCIIIVDEATTATDAMVQAAIAQNFAQCTVLTIAHRINSVINNDKILAMDAGQVAEFDRPLSLLRNPAGVFTRLVNGTGQDAARKLRQMVENKVARELAADKK